MREKKVFKWFAAALIAAAAIITATVPASAATRRRATLTISAGQTYHVLNKSIGTNKISLYGLFDPSQYKDQIRCSDRILSKGQEQSAYRVYGAQHE